MARSLAEEAVSRVMQYLASAGVTPTTDVMRDTLQLVSEVLDAAGPLGTPDPATFMAEVMNRVAERFELPEPLLPPAAPPLARGSIHYDER